MNATAATDAVVVNGETCTPATHVFENGNVVLKKDGTPKRRPGRKPKDPTAAAAPKIKVVKAPKVKPAPSADAPAPTAKVANNAPVTATVTRTFGKIGAPESKDETIEVKTFVTPPASIELGYGLTLNIGNYESARVDVKLSVPCYKEEVDDAYAWAKKWAEERLQQEVKDVRALASPKPNSPF